MKNNDLMHSNLVQPDVLIIDPAILPQPKLPASAFKRNDRGVAIAIINQKFRDFLGENRFQAFRSIENPEQ